MTRRSPSAPSPSTTTPPSTLLARLPRQDPVAWLRRGDGLVGWGVAARLRTPGPTRFTDADKWWSETIARATVRRRGGRARERARGLRFLRVRRRARRLGPGGAPGRRRPARRPCLADHGRPRRSDVAGPRGGRRARSTSRSPTAPSTASSGWRWSPRPWRGSRRASVEKVVLARDLIATADAPIDVRWPLARLTEGYPMCWTFHVDGLFGATPEMLVRRERGPGDLAGAGRDHPPHRRRRAGPRAGRDPGPVVEGPRGARVRRALGRRRAGPALLVDERARGAVRAAPAQRHAPRHRRRRRRARLGDGLVAEAGGVPAPVGGRRAAPRPAGAGADHRDRGHAARALRRSGRLDRRQR